MMRRVLRYGTFLSCAAVLVFSSGWNLRTLLAFTQADAGAGALDKAILAGFKWRSLGPPRGGRSIAASGVKGRPKEGYFGAVGGGLWKTIDGGVEWTPVTDGQINSSS